MLHIDKLCVMQPDMLDAVQELAARNALGHIRDRTARVHVDASTPNLSPADLLQPDCLDGCTVLGACDLQIASHATIAAILDFGDFEFFGIAASAREKRSRRRRLLESFRGVHVVRVNPAKGPWKPADVIVAKEPFLRGLAVERRLAKPGAQALARVDSTEQIRDRHVIGEIKWDWAGEARQVTELSVGGVLSMPGITAELQETFMALANRDGDHPTSYRVADVPPDELR